MGKFLFLQIFLLTAHQVLWEQAAYVGGGHNYQLAIPLPYKIKLKSDMLFSHRYDAREGG